MPSGYHRVESLMLPLAKPYDTLGIGMSAEPETSQDIVKTAFFTACEQKLPIPDIDPKHNTLTRAAAWHADQTGFNPYLDIQIYKGIPHGAGLGGGSSNAAALLLWLRERAEMAGVHVPDFAHFVESAAVIGADVPFFLKAPFLQGEAALAEGIGEKLRPAANPYAGYILLLACPGAAISTAWAFAALARERGEKNRSGGLTSEEGRDKSTLRNDFEAIVFAAYPELGRLYDWLLQSGAVAARMSGTGSSLFGLYREGKTAVKAAKILAKDGVRVYIQRLPEH